jgi:hypothetical protein
MADPAKVSASHLPELHSAVIHGDPAALAQIWIELWRPLCRRLERRFRLAPTDLVADAATDGLLAYIASRHTFDPMRRVPLEMFVFGIAARMLRDRLQGMADS